MDTFVTTRVFDHVTKAAAEDVKRQLRKLEQDLGARLAAAESRIAKLEHDLESASKLAPIAAALSTFAAAAGSR